MMKIVMIETGGWGGICHPSGWDKWGAKNKFIKMPRLSERGAGFTVIGRKRYELDNLE